MTIGCFIYAITNLKTGRRYVGSAINVKRRWGEHRSNLRNNKHHCRYLQNSWNKYGEHAFVFSILESLPTNDKKSRLGAELLAIGSSPCFNAMIANVFGGNFENSAEVRARISKSGLKHYQDNPERAVRHSAAMKKLFSDQSVRETHGKLTKASQTADVRKRKSASAKVSWTDPNIRHSRLVGRRYPESSESRSLRMKAWWASPEGQAAISKRTKRLKEYWDDPNSKFRKRKHVSKWQDPEVRKAQSEGLKAVWADPNSGMHTKANGWDNPKARQRLSKSLKSAWADPNSKYHTMKSKRWSDPEAKQRASKKMKEAWARRKAAASD